MSLYIEGTRQLTIEAEDHVPDDLLDLITMEILSLDDVIELGPRRGEFMIEGISKIEFTDGEITISFG